MVIQAVMALMMSSATVHASECETMRILAARVMLAGGQADTAAVEEACGSMLSYSSPYVPPALPSYPSSTSSGMLSTHSSVYSPVVLSRPEHDCEAVAAGISALLDAGGTLGPYAGVALRCGVKPSGSSSRYSGPWSFSNARQTSGYGWRRHPVLRKRKFHTGLDLDADYGDGVPALATGIVVHSGRKGGYGNMVELRHPITGLHTRYAHNSKLNVQKGDLVIAGQIIAQAGSTGMSTGVHVHLEVRDKNGDHLDPTPYMKSPAKLTGG